MRREFAMPDVGEGLTEAEIITWMVAPGDPIAVNQVFAEIETAKAAVELPSPFAGTVLELLVPIGRTVDVGTPILAVETAEAGAPAPAARPTPAATSDDDEAPVANLVGYGPRPGSVTRRPRKSPAVPTAPVAVAPPPPAPVATAPAKAPAVNGAHGPIGPNAQVPLAKPPVRKLARDLGIDLRTVAGSGAGGVITRSDLQGHQGSAAGAPVAAPAAAGSGERREPIRGVRKATAAAVTSSAFTAPHVTEFLAIDITETMALRERLRATREYRDVKLTPLAFVAKAVCLAARRTPEVNARWDEAAGEIVFHDRVQLGIAAATPRGLIVPKVRDADTLTVKELAAAIAALTEVARSGKTPPSDLVGGTFTITNVGVFGVDTGTPILNPGEAGILAVGAIKPAPWVVDGQLAVRTVCQLSLSFDHRLVDGEQGSRFLADVGRLLSDPAVALTW